MDDIPNPERTIASLLELLHTTAGFRWEHAISSRQSDAAAHEGPSVGKTPAGVLEVVLSGPDTPLLLDRNGELLHAIESLVAAALRLDLDQMESLAFDAGGFKAARAAGIARLADEGISRVRAMGRPHSFPPMNSLERRLLHLALVPSGLATASSGTGPGRFVVLYPEGQTPPPERAELPSRRPGNGPRPFRSGNGYRRTPASPQPGMPRDASPVRRGPAEALDEDGEPNGNIAPGSGDASGTTDARLETIRRAFRKR